jgi:hypothetical protein
MGYWGFHFRSPFVLIGILLLGLVSASPFILPISTMSDVRPELQPIPDAFVEPSQFVCFLMIPQEIVTNVDDTFLIQIFAENVTDMHAWQIHLNFDPRFIQCVNVSVPDRHVFSNRYPVSQALMEWNSTEFTERPLQYINNDKGYVLTGDCLLGSNQTTFNGSGFLVQVALKATSLGLSYLTLSLSQTYYIDSIEKLTTPTVFSSRVLVIPTGT